ncbi:hypothetical protein H6771_00495 [Candidatus Peribacteria bacterium]|nr:hypothetical protein [Candidatus Peribacteria bacterium]
MFSLVLTLISRAFQLLVINTVASLVIFYLVMVYAIGDWNIFHVDYSNTHIFSSWTGPLQLLDQIQGAYLWGILKHFLIVMVLSFIVTTALQFTQQRSDDYLGALVGFFYGMSFVYGIPMMYSILWIGGIAIAIGKERYHHRYRAPNTEGAKTLASISITAIGAYLYLYSIVRVFNAYGLAYMQETFFILWPFYLAPLKMWLAPGVHFKKEKEVSYLKFIVEWILNVWIGVLILSRFMMGFSSGSWFFMLQCVYLSIPLFLPNEVFHTIRLWMSYGILYWKPAGIDAKFSSFKGDWKTPYIVVLVGIVIIGVFYWFMTSVFTPTQFIESPTKLTPLLLLFGLLYWIALAITYKDSASLDDAGMGDLILHNADEKIIAELYKRLKESPSYLADFYEKVVNTDQKYQQWEKDCAEIEAAIADIREQIALKEQEIKKIENPVGFGPVDAAALATAQGELFGLQFNLLTQETKLTTLQGSPPVKESINSLLAPDGLSGIASMELALVAGGATKKKTILPFSGYDPFTGMITSGDGKTVVEIYPPWKEKGTWLIRLLLTGKIPVYIRRKPEVPFTAEQVPDIIISTV